MSGQGILFSAPSVPASAGARASVSAGPGPTYPRARRDDPRSSHEAAAQADGFAHKQAEAVLLWLRRYPGSTSHELARVSGLDRYAIARRLPELRERGLARRSEYAEIPCAVSGKRVCRWWVV